MTSGTILKTPFLTSHPEVLALLSGIGNDLRWKPDGEYFSITVDDRYGMRLFSTPYKPLEPLREYVEGLFRPSAMIRNRRNRMFLNYELRRDGQIYKASVLIVPRILTSNGKSLVTLPALTARTPSPMSILKRRVQPKIYRRLAMLKVPRSTTLRPSPETLQVPFSSVYERNIGGYAITQTTPNRVRLQRTWTGVRTPNFGRLRKSQLPVNPHSVKIQETPIDVLTEWTFASSTNWTNRYDRATLHYIAPSEPAHNMLARFNALRRLIGQNQLGIDANLAQDFAQLGQTTRLIGDTAYRLVGSVQALRRGNLVQAVDILWQGKRPRFAKGSSLSNGAKALANNWLALQYGWKPLLNDVHGALQSLKTLNSQGDLITTATASAYVRSVSSKSLSLWNFNTPGGQEVTSARTRCKIRLRYKIDDKLKVFLAQLGFTNPVNLAWEIIPFSFVADWFFPLGPFLETLSSWDGLVFMDGSQTLFTKSEAVLAIDYHGKGNINDPTRSYDCTARRVVKTILLDRTKLTSFPTQSIPSFKNGLRSVTHALNGLALLAKYFK